MRNAFRIAAAAVSLTLIQLGSPAQAAEIKEGDPAPTFKAKTHDGAEFDLASRKGKWTVLYFYPKADTPGCTKQACGFRDNIKKIRDQGGDVFGVSADTVEDQAKFHQKHKLNFTLLADPDAKIIDLFGTRMLGMKLSKRWTFVIDPELKVRKIAQDVDPVKDAENVANTIKTLKN